MYFLGFVFVMEIIMNIYLMATKNDSGHNDASQVPLNRSSKPDNNVHKKIYTSVHYRSGSIIKCQSVFFLLFFISSSVAIKIDFFLQFIFFSFALEILNIARNDMVIFIC